MPWLSRAEAELLLASVLVAVAVALLGALLT